MRPDKSVAHQTDRGLDLKKLWEQLGEEPPGEPKGLDEKPARRKTRAKGSSPPR